MPVNKVEINGKTVVDLTGDTVNKDNLLQGATAHDAAGNTVEGGVIVAPLSNKTPKDPGFSSAGTSTEASRADHVHQNEVAIAIVGTTTYEEFDTGMLFAKTAIAKDGTDYYQLAYSEFGKYVFVLIKADDSDKTYISKMITLSSSGWSDSVEVTDKNLSTKLSLTGGTMTGRIWWGANGDGVRMLDFFTLSTSPKVLYGRSILRGYSAEDASSGFGTNASNGVAIMFNNSKDIPLVIHTMTGDYKTGTVLFNNSNISMDGNFIHELAAPTEDTDAANKKYVDDLAGKIFVAEYGVTTQEQLEEAYSAGKIPVLLKDNRVYSYSYYGVYPTFINVNPVFDQVNGTTVLHREISGYQVNSSTWNALSTVKIVTDDRKATLGTPTTNYELNTWSGEPLVKLDELNENFATIETALFFNYRRTNDKYSAEWISAYHLAHRALESLHNGTLGDRSFDLILADFSLSGQWDSIYHLNLTDDLKKPIPASTGFSEASATFPGGVTGIGFQPANGLVQTVATFTAAQSGTVSKVVIRSSSGYNSAVVTLRVLEDGTQVGSDVSYSTTSTRTAPIEVAMSFTVTAGKTYTLQVVFPSTSGSSVSFGNSITSGTYAGKKAPLFVGTGTTYIAGYFTTPLVDIRRGDTWSASMGYNFGRLYVWLCHSGTTPSVEVRFNNSGNWYKLANLKTQDATSLSGNSAKRRWYRLNNWNSNYSTSSTLRINLRITLGSDTCIVDEICGVFLG